MKVVRKVTKGSSRSKGKTAQQKFRGSILLDEEVSRVQIMLDQISGCAEAMTSHLRERYDVDADSGTHALVAIIRERAEAASAMVGRSYGSLSPEAVELREKNLKAREQMERDLAERDARMAREREERAARIGKALDSVK